MLALVGVFPQETAPHVPVPAAFISVSLWADTLVRLREGARAWTLTSGLAGTANIGSWIAWVAAGAPWGVAVPEMLGALVFGTWVCLRSLELAAPQHSPLRN